MKLPMLLIPLFALLMHVKAGASIPDSSCEHFLVYANGKYRTWEYVTDRKSEMIYDFLTIQNSPTVLVGRRGLMPDYNFEGVAEGKLSVLSLGEGASNFIYKLLRKQADQFYPFNAWAVDMVYTDTEQFLNNVRMSKYEVASIEKMKSEFPRHYSGQYFQDMKFTTDKGEPRLFDEIISSNSIVYLLTKYHKEDAITDQSYLDVRKSDKELLATLVSHLKPGGILRMWPFLPERYRPVSKHLYMQGILDELLEEGVISNHNFTFDVAPEPTLDERSPDNFIVIQR